MNVVMTDSGELIEVQATGELILFLRSIESFIGYFRKGITELISLQKCIIRRI